MNQWKNFPYRSETDAVSGRYLYAVGGFHSHDNGCPGWGSSDPARIRFIGDRMGDLVIRYADGSQSRIPLVFGYTLWYHSIWMERPAPFLSDEAVPGMAELLQSVLSVEGAYEGKPLGVLRIELENKAIAEIYVEANPEKEGTPLYCGGYLTDEEPAGILRGGEREADASDPFFAAHTVRLSDVYPDACKEALQKICYALHTFEADFAEAPERFEAPEETREGRLRFSGSRLAEIASGVIYHNMRNLTARTDEDGFIHTSYQDAPSWRYDGFGPYVPHANSYTDSFYSRDGARAILTLNGFGDLAEAEHACHFGNRWLMYYPEQKLTIKGVPIPGHFSVIINKPLIYSTILVPQANWPTRYTKEEFGEGYQNLGNQETDGHGLMMLANYNVWKNLGSHKEWVLENWRYLREAAEWILWCFDHPELSFAQDGLLYGETEAAMNDWTLYANVPCYLGLLGYAEMAEAAQKTQDAEAWRACAESMRAGIERRLTKENGWDLKHCGFIHDPVPTMLSDFYGYDTADMPSEWVLRSRASYPEDIRYPAEHGFYGASGGIGYDHSMITQNALLLDQMQDASRLMEALSKLSYSPRLPEPYLIPEGLSVDAGKGVLRRQGDLGNLVQLAEAMKCYLITAGISPLRGKTLKIMPRLPEGWKMELQKFSVQNSDVQISVKTAYPENGRQSASVVTEGDLAELRIQFRFGPFPLALEQAEVTLNGRTQKVDLFPSGDSKWAWVSADAAGER